MDERVRLQRWTGSVCEDVEVLLRPRIGETELRDIETWKPLLQEQVTGDQDWDWRHLMEEARRKHGKGLGAGWLVLEERVQGAILFWMSKEPSRIDGGPLLYVDRLAVAPLNRSRAGRPGRVSPCGNVLMAYARRRSYRLGCGGRVGLHSLPQSEGFYAKLGMRRMDPVRDDERFAYFEWETEELR